MKRHAVEDLNPRRASRGAVMVLDDNSPQGTNHLRRLYGCVFLWSATCKEHHGKC